MKRLALIPRLVLLLAAAAAPEDRAAAQSAAPPPALALPTAAPPATTQAAVPAPVAPLKRGLTFADLTAQFPQNKEGHLLMEVPSIVNTSTDREAQVLLTGQAVETTGQVIPETVDNADGKSLRITRSQLQCCSAHARQCSVALKFRDKAPAFKEKAWVTLVGIITYKQEDGKTVPVVFVKEIKAAAAPKNELLQ